MLIIVLVVAIQMPANLWCGASEEDPTSVMHRRAHSYFRVDCLNKASVRMIACLCALCNEVNMIKLLMRHVLSSGWMCQAYASQPVQGMTQVSGYLSLRGTRLISFPKHMHVVNAPGNVMRLRESQGLEA